VLDHFPDIHLKEEEQRKSRKSIHLQSQIYHTDVPSRTGESRRPAQAVFHHEHGYNRIEVLLELVVENYAVVERLRIRFHAGLNLLTGETGSGKSLVVDALGLLLGGRTSAETIRTGESRARVAGIFDVRDHAPVRRLLEPAGLEIEEGELLIEREILGGGKSRAFVGSRPVSVALLKDLAPHLADIHGQHEQQLLFAPDAQRDMLDAFAGNRDPARPRRRPLPRVARRGGGTRGTGALRTGEAPAAGSVELPAQGNRGRRTEAR
jgi:hypothetical protein